MYYIAHYRNGLWVIWQRDNKPIEYLYHHALEDLMTVGHDKKMPIGIFAKECVNVIYCVGEYHLEIQ